MSDMALFQELYPNLKLIPDEILVGYHIAEEMDAWLLHRLYEVLGPEIIKQAALKQMEKWPGKPLYVASLRKRYRHRLPQDFYRYKPAEWGVYLLVALDHQTAKIGLSNNVPHRAFTLSGNNYHQSKLPQIHFDLKNSYVITGFASRSRAQAAEKLLKQMTADKSARLPGWSPVGSGESEWRSFDQHVMDSFLEVSKSDAGLSVVSVSSLPTKIMVRDLLT